jgi:hypothetical protein
MGWKGFIGGALQSAGKTGLDIYAREDAQNHDMEKMQKMSELAKQAEIERENRIAERAKDPTTAEGMKRQSAEIELGLLKDSRGVTDLRSRGEGQLSNGDFIVRGDDGMVRRTDKDGNLKGSAIKVEDFENGMLSAKDKAEIKYKNSAAARLDAEADYTLNQRGRGSSGSAGIIGEKLDAQALSQHDKQLGTFYTKQVTGEDGKTIKVPDTNLINRVQIVRDEMMSRGMGVNQAIAFSRAFVTAAGPEAISGMTEDQLATSAMSFYKKRTSSGADKEPAKTEGAKPEAKPAAVDKPVEKPIQQSADSPSYEKFMRYRSELDDVKKRASKMSPDAREQFLESRVPDLERMISYHSKYRTY